MIRYLYQLFSIILVVVFFGNTKVEAAAVTVNWDTTIPQYTCNAIYSYLYDTNGNITTYVGADFMGTPIYMPISGGWTFSPGGKFGNDSACNTLTVVAAHNVAITDASVYAPGATITLYGQSNIPVGNINNAVGVSSSMGGICSAGTGCAGTITFPAPLTPGPYTIGLTACWQTPAHCTPSSIMVTIVAPPTVQINFSFLDRVKAFVTGSFVGKVFASQ